MADKEQTQKPSNEPRNPKVPILKNLRYGKPATHGKGSKK